MKNLVFSSLFLFLSLLSHADETLDLNTAVKRTGVYTPLSGEYSVEASFDKLKVGELIGSEIPKKSEKIDLQAKGKELTKKPGEFISWAREESQRSSGELRRSTQDLQKDISAGENKQDLVLTTSFLHKKTFDESFSAFRSCALRALPLMKYLVAAIKKGNDDNIHQYGMKLFDLTGQIFTQVKKGELVCGNLLGPANFKVTSPDMLGNFVEQSVILSVFLQTSTAHASAAKNALFTLWSRYTKKDPSPLWVSYWKYLSVQLVLAGRKNIDSPEVFASEAKKDDWKASVQQNQNEFSKWASEKQLGID